MKKVKTIDENTNKRYFASILTIPEHSKYLFIFVPCQYWNLYTCTSGTEDMKIKFKIEKVIILLGLTVLVPTLILSFFNHPAGDDIRFAIAINQFGFLGSFKFWHENWTIGMFSLFLMNIINPASFEWWIGYKIVPVIFILLFLFSLFHFIKTATRNIISVYEQWALVLSFVFIYLYNLPGPESGFYWVTYLALYQSGNILTLLLLAILIKNINNKEPKKIYYFSIASILLFLSQLNTTNTAFTFVTLVFFAILKMIYDKKISKYFLILLAIITASTLFFLLSPGLNVRVDGHPDMKRDIGPFVRLLYAVWFSIRMIVVFCIKRSPLLILFTIILLPVYNNILSEKNKMSSLHQIIINPFIAFVIMIASPMLYAIPSSWVGQGRPALWIQNISYFYFLLGWMYLLLCITDYVRKKYIIPEYNLNWLRWLCVIFVIGSVALPNNIRATTGDILLGRAARFDSLLVKRSLDLKECAMDTCFVDSLYKKDNPASLYLEGQWAGNYGAYSRFFNKKKIMIKK